MRLSDEINLFNLQKLTDSLLLDPAFADEYSHLEQHMILYHGDYMDYILDNLYDSHMAILNSCISINQHGELYLIIENNYNYHAELIPDEYIEAQRVIFNKRYMEFIDCDHLPWDDVNYDKCYGLIKLDNIDGFYKSLSLIMPNYHYQYCQIKDMNIVIEYADNRFLGGDHMFVKTTNVDNGKSICNRSIDNLEDTVINLLRNLDFIM